MVDMRVNGVKKTPLGWVRHCFDIARKNALKNNWLYDFRFTQRNRKDAYIEYLEHIIETQGYKIFRD